MACRPAALGFCFLLLISVACCTHLAPPVPFPYASQCPPDHVLLDAVRMPAPPVVKAIAKIKVESPDETFSVKELIVAQKPNRLRLETLSPLGQPGFYAATDGQDLFLFNPSENTYYHGLATPHNLGLIIPLNLGVEEMVSVIMGMIPLIDYDADQLLCTVKEDGYVIHLKARDESTTQVLTLAQENLRVVASEIYDGEGLTCSVTYKDYKVVGDHSFPGEITVFLPPDRTTVRINYKNVEFLPEIDSSLFRLSAPQGATVVPLE